MPCSWGPFKKPRSGSTPENDTQTLNRGDSLDSGKELSENGIEDTNGPSISGSNRKSTRTHRTSHVSALQDQVEDIQPYGDLLSSGWNAQPTEVWTDNGNPNFTTAENGSLRDAAIAQSEHSNFRTSNSCQSPSRRPRSRETFRVPYVFEFVPFPGHICTGRGTIPLGTVTVSVDENAESPLSFKYDASFRRLLNEYNSQNRRVFANEPVALRHFTEVSLRCRIEFSASVQLVRDIRVKKILVATLLKRYPECQECRNRGRLQDVPTP
ncbi:hypothetical protein NA56DRAFT_640928 [Hyaloscypha hepaticicola]|uniref:Uncharacterized protein n=1 Tax=Hyaloscypha hepaticicola TaxID=2082293 RepID=A0A2J6QLM9_9HELO|nr:hypothetical protein NA56DRAFT_640928 [Hyaloscypha hepaticicola]